MSIFQHVFNVDTMRIGGSFFQQIKLSNTINNGEANGIKSLATCLMKWEHFSVEIIFWFEQIEFNALELCIFFIRSFTQFHIPVAIWLNIPISY